MPRIPLIAVVLAHALLMGFAFIAITIMFVVFSEQTVSKNANALMYSTVSRNERVIVSAMNNIEQLTLSTSLTQQRVKAFASVLDGSLNFSEYTRVWDVLSVAQVNMEAITSSFEMWRVSHSAVEHFLDSDPSDNYAAWRATGCRDQLSSCYYYDAVMNVTYRIPSNVLLSQYDVNNVSIVPGIPDRFERSVAFLENGIRFNDLGTWSPLYADFTNSSMSHECGNMRVQNTLTFFHCLEWIVDGVNYGEDLPSSEAFDSSDGALRPQCIHAIGTEIEMNYLNVVNALSVMNESETVLYSVHSEDFTYGACAVDPMLRRELDLYLQTCNLALQDCTPSIRKQEGTFITADGFTTDTGLFFVIIDLTPYSFFYGVLEQSKHVSISIASVVITLVVALGVLVWLAIVLPIRRISIGMIRASRLSGESGSGMKQVEKFTFFTEVRQLYTSYLDLCKALMELKAFVPQGLFMSAQSNAAKHSDSLLSALLGGESGTRAVDSLAGYGAFSSTSSSTTTSPLASGDDDDVNDQTSLFSGRGETAPDTGRHWNRRPHRTHSKGHHADSSDVFRGAGVELDDIGGDDDDGDEPAHSHGGVNGKRQGQKKQENGTTLTAAGDAAAASAAFPPRPPPYAVDSADGKLAYTPSPRNRTAACSAEVLQTESESQQPRQRPPQLTSTPPPPPVSSSGGGATGQTSTSMATSMLRSFTMAMRERRVSSAEQKLLSVPSTGLGEARAKSGVVTLVPVSAAGTSRAATAAAAVATPPTTRGGRRGGGGTATAGACGDASGTLKGRNALAAGTACRAGTSGKPTATGATGLAMSGPRGAEVTVTSDVNVMQSSMDTLTLQLNEKDRGDVNQFRSVTCSMMTLSFEFRYIDTNSLTAEVSALMASAVKLIIRCNGVIEVLRPDFLIVSFGAHSVLPQHVQLAAICAIKIMRKIPSKLRPRTRIVVDSGMFFVGNCGSYNRYARVVFGDRFDFGVDLMKYEMGLGRLIVTDRVALCLPAEVVVPIDNLVPLRNRIHGIQLFQLLDPTRRRSDPDYREGAARFREAYRSAVGGDYAAALAKIEAGGLHDAAMAAYMANAMKYLLALTPRRPRFCRFQLPGFEPLGSELRERATKYQYEKISLHDIARNSVPSVHFGFGESSSSAMVDPASQSHALFQPGLSDNHTAGAAGTAVPNAVSSPSHAAGTAVSALHDVAAAGGSRSQHSLRFPVTNVLSSPPHSDTRSHVNRVGGDAAVTDCSSPTVPRWNAGSTLMSTEVASNENSGSMQELPLTFVDHRGLAWHRMPHPIGTGAFAEVYKAISESGALMALKCIRLSAQHVQLPDVVQEVNTACKLHHDNVVHHFGWAHIGSFLVIIMEYMSGGTLQNVCSAFPAGVTMMLAKRYAADSLKGLAYLHRNNIVHADLKPQNILISVDGACKISDFGSSVTKANAMACGGDVFNLRGTPLYMSPEVAAGAPPSKQSDIFSFGITLYEMLTGKLPWVMAKSVPPARRLSMNTSVFPPAATAPAAAPPVVPVMSVDSIPRTTSLPIEGSPRSEAEATTSHEPSDSLRQPLSPALVAPFSSDASGGGGGGSSSSSSSSAPSSSPHEMKAITTVRTTIRAADGSDQPAAADGALPPPPGPAAPIDGSTSTPKSVAGAANVVPEHSFGFSLLSNNTTSDRQAGAPSSLPTQLLSPQLPHRPPHTPQGPPNSHFQHQQQQLALALQMPNKHLHLLASQDGIGEAAGVTENSLEGYVAPLASAESVPSAVGMTAITTTPTVVPAAGSGHANTNSKSSAAGRAGSVSGPSSVFVTAVNAVIGGAARRVTTAAHVLSNGTTHGHSHADANGSGRGGGGGGSTGRAASFSAVEEERGSPTTSAVKPPRLRSATITTASQTNVAETTTATTALAAAGGARSEDEDDCHFPLPREMLSGGGGGGGGEASGAQASVSGTTSSSNAETVYEAFDVTKVSDVRFVQSLANESITVRVHSTDLPSNEAFDLISQCLRLNPSARPDASKLIEHPFFLF